MSQDMMGRDDLSRVTVAIPCHNEMHTIGEVVADFIETLPGARVIVLDNASTDDTARIALEAGAELVPVPLLGKGNAVRKAFGLLDSDVVLLIDGDATYDPRQAVAVVRPVLDGEADMVVGERLTRAPRHAFRPFRHSANVIMTSAVNHLLGTHVRDALSGYRALTRDLVRQMDLQTQGFEIETELLCECRRLGGRVAEVAILYDKRHDESASKLIPWSDAARIMRTAWRSRRRR